MPTLQEIHAPDSIGITRFTDKQLQGMVAMIKRTGKLECDPPRCSGKGIVIAGGGKYLDWCIVLVRWLRELGCQLPVQVWHLGAIEMPEWGRKALAKYGAEPVDAMQMLKMHPHRMIMQYVAQKKWTYAGWTLKNYALTHCPWEDVLFLDADCFPCVNPEELFREPEVRAKGTIFFSDICNHAPGPWFWIYCGLEVLPKEAECGQYIVNKRKGWMGLVWANWLCEHADTCFSLVHGDKDLSLAGYRIAEAPHIFSQECTWESFGISQRWKGKEWFRHSMNFKRGEGNAPFPRVQELFWEIGRRLAS